MNLKVLIFVGALFALNGVNAKVDRFPIDIPLPNADGDGMIYGCPEEHELVEDPEYTPPRICKPINISGDTQKKLPHYTVQENAYDLLQKAVNVKLLPEEQLKESL